MVLLITGAAGFIGSNFVSYYLEKHQKRKLIALDKLTYAGNLENLSEVIAKHQDRLKFIKGDINDKKAIESIFSEYEVNGVINFAAESHVDRSIQESQIFLKTNVLGTQILLDACKKYWYQNDKWIEGKKFLQISTDEVYGSLGPTGAFTEKTPLDPHSPYSASKASGDLIVKAYCDTYKMPINITRCSNNYGPYQFPEKLIPLMINNALNHQKLPVYGDGKHIRDWIYVKDHCKAVDIVFENGQPGETYNIGGNNQKENIFVVKKIIDLLYQKTEDEKINDNLISFVEDRPGHDRRYAIDSTKIERELFWKPEVSLDEGMEKTIQWYLDNRNWTKRVTSGEYLSYYEENYGKRKNI